MKRCLLLLPVLLLVAGADPAVERAARKERARLLGAWLAAPPDFLQPDEVLAGGWWPIFEITGDKINVTTIQRERGKIVRKPAGTMTAVIDPTANPKTIDLTENDGPRKGNVRVFIYELNGDTLKLAEAHGKAPRPTTFTRDRHTSVLVFRRFTPEALAKALATLEEQLQKLDDKAKSGDLATSRMAKPVAAKSDGMLTLELARDGSLLAPGRDEPLDSSAKLKQYLQEQSKQARAGLVLRANYGASAASLHRAVQTARDQGIAAVFVQVQCKSGGEGRLEVFLPDWRKPIDVTVVAQRAVEDDGALGAVGVKSGASTTRVESLDSLELLEKQLKEERNKETTPNKDSVTIRPDAGLKMASLVRLMDSCLAAGFSRVAIGIFELDPTAGVKPVPSAADQKKAEMEIKTIYQAHYAKPAILAATLHDAAEICEEPAAKFVLLREAADAAARNGQLVASLDLFDELAREFAVDPWPLKLEKFKKAPMNQATADAALREASNADLAKRREYTARFIRIAEIAAKESKDSDLAQYVEERRTLLKLPNLDNTNPFAPMRSAQDNEPSAALVERMTATPVSVLSLVLWYGVPVVLVGVLLTAGMIWWMRRERAVRRRLSQARGRQFELPSEEPPVGG